MLMQLDRLEKMMAEGRIVAGQWTGTDDAGREIACLVAGMYPGTTSPDNCPAEDLPRWILYLLPSLFDGISKEYRPSFLSRYAALMRRNQDRPISDEAWARMDYTMRAFAVRLAAKDIDDQSVAADYETVARLCDRAASSDMPTPQDFSVAAAAAKKASAEVAWSAAAKKASAEVAWSAAAAEAVAWSAAAAAWSAAAAAEAAAEVAWSAARARSATEAAVEVARSVARSAAAKAWDEIAGKLLDAIEVSLATPTG